MECTVLNQWVLLGFALLQGDSRQRRTIGRLPIYSFCDPYWPNWIASISTSGKWNYINFQRFSLQFYQFSAMFTQIRLVSTIFNDSLSNVKDIFTEILLIFNDFQQKIIHFERCSLKFYQFSTMFNETLSIFGDFHWKSINFQRFSLEVL